MNDDEIDEYDDSDYDDDDDDDDDDDADNGGAELNKLLQFYKDALSLNHPSEEKKNETNIEQNNNHNTDNNQNNQNNRNNQNIQNNQQNQHNETEKVLKNQKDIMKTKSVDEIIQYAIEAQDNCMHSIARAQLLHNLFVAAVQRANALATENFELRKRNQKLKKLYNCRKKNKAASQTKKTLIFT